jgi:hypothetical protein
VDFAVRREGRPPNQQRVKDKALFAREETVRLTGIAKTGHYASAFSCAELYYGDVMRLKQGNCPPGPPHRAEG